MSERAADHIPYDLSSHHALGGGSYVFRSNYPAYLRSLLPDTSRRTELNVIIQPNGSSRIGTLCSIVLTFVVARRMVSLGLEVSVTCDLWDRANGEQQSINGVTYQRSLRDVGRFQRFLPEYVEILRLLSDAHGVNYRLRMEEEFLSNQEIPGVIRDVILKRHYYAKYLALDKGVLSIRAACPQCGLIEKCGTKNTYAEDGTTASFECPIHGRFSLDVNTQANLFHFNCQTFNLVLALFYERVPHNYIEVCGGDYAGFWQEQLVWRFLSKPIIIVYTPLISDWSGSKISKSLYLQKAAYEYLRQAGQEYLLNYSVFREQGNRLTILCKEIELWIDQPYRLFRVYSIHYIHLLFERKEIALGITHEEPAQPEID